MLPPSDLLPCHGCQPVTLGYMASGPIYPETLIFPLVGLLLYMRIAFIHWKDMRARAFHILDPKGTIEMLLIFLEGRGGGVLIPPLTILEDNTNRIIPYLGKGKGHSITRRSGDYGATIAEADTISVLKIDDEGRLIQDITSTSSGSNVSTNVHWTGTMSNNLVKFDGGFQVTLLPGGMYMGCPFDVSKSVAESKSFHLEFCWLELPRKRQRLVRTHDVEDLAVSSTYFFETKL